MSRAFSIALCGILGLALTACGETPGSRITFSAIAPQAGAGPFAVGDWTVDVEEARLALGPLYVFADPSATASASPLRRLLGPARAHAHPGHGEHGDVMAEVLRQSTVDLVAGWNTLGEGTGLTGRWDTLEVMLQPSEALDGMTARLRATATRGEDTVSFEVAVAMDRHADEIPLGVMVESDEGQLEIAIDLFSWVERIDFDALFDEFPDAGGRLVLEPGSQAQDALFIGVRSRAAFDVAWVRHTHLAAER